MNRKEQALAFVIIFDIFVLGAALLVSGSVQTMTGGNDQIRYTGPSTTTLYPNGTELSTSVSHLVPMSSTESNGLWILLIGGILFVDYFLLIIDSLIPKYVRFNITRPLTPEAIDEAAAWFKLRLKMKSDDLAQEKTKE